MHLMGNQWFLSNQILLYYLSHSKIWSYNFYHLICLLALAPKDSFERHTKWNGKKDWRVKMETWSSTTKRMWPTLESGVRKRQSLWNSFSHNNAMEEYEVNPTSYKFIMNKKNCNILCHQVPMKIHIENQQDFSYFRSNNFQFNWQLLYKQYTHSRFWEVELIVGYLLHVKSSWINSYVGKYRRVHLFV